MDNFTRQRLTKEALNFVYADEDNSGELQSECRYNLREFTIVKTEAGLFYPFELTPTGVLYLGVTPDGPVYGNFDHQYADRIREAYQASPNDFSATLKNLNIDPATLCKSGGGYSRTTIMYPTFDEALHAIFNAIEDDAPLRSHRTQEEYEELKGPFALLQEERAFLEGMVAHIRARTDNPPNLNQETVFGNLANLFNEPMNDDCKKKLLDYINAPTLDKWHDVSGYLVTSAYTLWQALGEVGFNVPKLGSEFTKSNIPSSDAVVETLKKIPAIAHKQDLASLREWEGKLNDINDKLSQLEAKSA